MKINSFIFVVGLLLSLGNMANANTNANDCIADCKDLGIEVLINNDSFPGVNYLQPSTIFSNLSISGRVRMPNGKAVTNVFPVINSAMAGHPDTIPTTNTGYYEFQVMPGLDYTVNVFRDVQDYLNGVSTLDMVLIGRHIIGVSPFQSRWQLVASDVNNDKRISVLDMIEIRKLILGATEQWTAPSWWFFDASVEEEDPFMMQIPTFVYFEDLDRNIDNADFIAVKTGDVNYNAVPLDRENETQVRNQDYLNFLTNNRKINKGESIDLAITSDNFKEVFGYQFSLEMNGLKLREVKPGFLLIDASNYAMPKSNVMTMSWNEAYAQSAAAGEVLFTLKMESERDGFLSEMLKMSSSITKAEAYTGEGMKIVEVDLEFRNLSNEGSFEMFQNVPNPFKEFTSLEYNIPEEGEVTLSVFDTAGKLLFNKKTSANRGSNFFNISRNELGGVKGILIYQLEYANTKATKKMIAID